MAAPTPAGSSWPYAVSGLLAAASGSAVGHVVAAGVSPPASPVLAVGSAVIDATPRTVKEWAVASLGAADKPVLLGSVLMVTAALAVGVGLLARSHRRAAFLALVGLVALAGLAAVTSAAPAGAESAVLLPSLATGSTALAVLALLTGRADAWRRAEDEARGAASSATRPAGPTESPLDHNARATGSAAQAARRTFLLGAGGVGVGSLAVGALGQTWASPHALARAIPLPAVAEPLPPLPVGLETTVPGVSPLRTAAHEFYRIDTALVVPDVDPATWQLTIDGLVDREVSIGFDELVALGLVERDITLNCVSNEVGGGYIGSTRWGGVPVRLLLERAGVRDDADQVLSTSVDGMTISTPLEALLATGDREALIAVAMAGEPLSREHGFPARLVTPGLYGYVGTTKWVARLTVTTFAQQQAYWSRRGWAERAEVQVQTRIDTPVPGRGAPAGTVPIGGVAWAQATGGISRVEVQVDDGPWQEARLGPTVGPTYWRQWWLPWSATPGRHRLTARATDGTGSVQTSTVAEPAPSGATGWHSVDITVR